MTRLFGKLMYPTHLKRFVFFFSLDILTIIISLYLSFLLRFDFILSAESYHLIIKSLPLFLIVKLSSLAIGRLYKITWRYVGLHELLNITYAIVISELVLMSFIIYLNPLPMKFDFLPLPDFTRFPRSIFIIDGIITFLLTSFLRVSKRLYLEILRGMSFYSDGKRAIIIGAGRNGEMLVRDMIRQGYREYFPVCILDDDIKYQGTYVHGVKVFGEIGALPDIIQQTSAEVVIVAIPSLDHKRLRSIYDIANDAEIKSIKVVPRIYTSKTAEITLKALEDLPIADLIGRQTVKVYYDEISSFINDKVILVTGAGGSIGSEISVQMCGFSPRKMILLDNDETSLYDLELKLNALFPRLKENIMYVAGDVRDKVRVQEVFRCFRPEIVFHAAAYKHVPMMETNATEAVNVNIFGTFNVVNEAIDKNVKKFILVSTDKAVRPTSIMGATKRVAEYICSTFNKISSVEFVSVRFGNVLGSRGSVLPTFMNQLKHGGPLTVTHKDMKRYFMTIPEAVSLVLQASVIGKGGEVLVLDMGEPVRIVDLAEELIRIHGLQPYSDIDIQFIGLRPGEKLFEEILTAEEGTVATKHDRVYISKNRENMSNEQMENILKELRESVLEARIGDDLKIKDILKRYVKHFNPEQSLYSSE